MTTPAGDTIIPVSTVIMALCAVGALCLSFWKAPKPSDAKLAILFGLAQLTCAVAIVMACYFVLATDGFVLAPLCAFYAYLVQVGLFAVFRFPATRGEILTIVGSALFFATVTFYATTKVSFKVQLQMAQAQKFDEETQTKIISNQAQIISVLGKLTGMPTPTPSPSPSAVPHNP